MESGSSSPTPAQASAALAAAEASRATLAEAIVLPSWFFTSIGAAITVQIATAAVAIGANTLWPLVAGVLVFAAVAAAQLWRFRRLSGTWLGGLASRVVLGTAGAASLAYAAALAAAVWAAGGGHWWAVAVCSVAGGAGYALSGRRWMRGYRADPAAQARGESPLQVAVLAAVAVVCLAALLLAH